ncbi:YeaH/YhbH family protein [bacterium]|nr:YeaH/YhbH family protein [Actinomycetota bacterium]NDG31470.1 YeaH/YhbH family protein [bacterium]
MTTIIDRRLNPRDKTIKNRQKFINRSREQIRKSVKEAIKTGNISDIENEKVRVRVKGIDEPEFSINPKTGDKEYVLPGNDKYVVGDTEPKPKGGEGEGGNKGGLGTSEDDFEFLLSRDEYLDFIFEDLELPDLIKKQMKDVTKIKPKRSGYSNQGNPNQLDIMRSLKNSLGRRIGLQRPKNEEIEQLEQQLEEEQDPAIRLELEERIKHLRSRQMSVPWLDPFDVRYRHFIPKPEPMTKAVMFCILDVSGSMGEFEKDLAKRFFLLLHMFLFRKYTKVDIVFIRHHETAKEVDEHEFFNSKESGGTLVSEALKLANKIIKNRYNVNDYNIYVAQCSDGDNFERDKGPATEQVLALLPKVQYMAYLEIISQIKQQFGYPMTDLWKVYQPLTSTHKNLKLQKASEAKLVWKVFKELFGREKLHYE